MRASILVRDTSQGHQRSPLGGGRLSKQGLDPQGRVPLGADILAGPYRAPIVPATHTFTAHNVVGFQGVTDEFGLLLLGYGHFFDQPILLDSLIVTARIQHLILLVPVTVLVGCQTVLGAAKEASVVLVLYLGSELDLIIFWQQLVAVPATD